MPEAEWLAPIARIAIVPTSAQLETTAMNVRPALLTLLFSALLVCGASCQRSGSEKLKVEAPPGGVLLRGAGATFPAPLYQKWFTKYRQAHPDVVVAYDEVGSGEGIKRFIGKSKELSEDELVDFAASDAAMSDAEIAEVDRGVQLLPATAGVVVLAYNLPDLQSDLKLSQEVFAGILLGKITQWNDPRIVKDNPGVAFPKLTIAFVARQDSSGTTFALTTHLSAVSEQWRAQFGGGAKYVNWPGNVMRANGNEGVAGRIKQSIGSLGYVHYGFAKRLGLKMALLQNKAGHFVRPTERSGAATLASARLPNNLRLYFPDPEGEESYPIVTFSWVLLYRNYADAKTAAVVKDLFRWCLTEGQQFSGELGYLRLAPNVVSAATAAVDAIGPQ
jgi:phosphate transport system substrate-binding protein